jgi:hypothetical protein
MTYEAHLHAAESAFWPLETSVPWDHIDRQTAAREGEIHQALYDAALIEGYLPLYASRLLQLLAGDVAATAVLSLELFEGLRHYTALKRYLELVGFRTAAQVDAGLEAARAGAGHRRYSADEVPAHLTHFMGSELFAAYFFLRMADQTRETVLRELLKRMASDEFRHAAAAGAVLEARVRGAPALQAQVLSAARSFRHYGSDIVEVPVAQPNDFEAIAAFDRKVRLICGAS